MHLKTNDIVEILTGKDRSKPAKDKIVRGKVLAIDHEGGGPRHGNNRTADEHGGVAIEAERLSVLTGGEC